ncbi:hypothetical protein BDN72DRAFT_831057 [Pluteus cervinus]|uniref:Uncharacterized protein n=1 Tax=Pluteus cervinus TaxID=181527 RepID=A0ACD3BFT8_9AGAR|nr:hypothetical protein BDN72DRAFT_831057 [Pluteus cervinus]
MSASFFNFFLFHLLLPTLAEIFLRPRSARSLADQFFFAARVDGPTPCVPGNTPNHARARLQMGAGFSASTGLLCFPFMPDPSDRYRYSEMKRYLQSPGSHLPHWDTQTRSDGLF